MSFDPNPGDPTEMTITETLKHKSSNGTIIYEAVPEACLQFSGGFECDGGFDDPRIVGIATK